MHPFVLLASASPRRRQLMAALGIRCRTVKTGIHEAAASLPPAEHARLLAWKKAEWARKLLRSGRAAQIVARQRGRIIVGADTLVAVGRTIFGKPRSRADARSQLLRLSGRKHMVITGLAMLEANRHLAVIASECSEVTMRKLSGAEIDAYVNSGEPLGKAGSYAIQAKGKSLVASLKGDYFNVVGFPLRLFASLAPAFGLRVSGRRLAALYKSIPALNGRGRFRY